MPTAVNTVLLSVSFKPISVDFTSVLNIVSLDRTSTVTMFAFATAIVLWYTIVVVQVYYELLLLDGYIYIASTPPPPPPPSPPTHTLVEARHMSFSTSGEGYIYSWGEGYDILLGLLYFFFSLWFTSLFLINFIKNPVYIYVFHQPSIC